MDVVCRPELDADEVAVRDVVRRAFGKQRVADLVDSLRASADWAFGAVAVGSGELVGYVGFSHGVLDAPPRLVDVLVLSPLGVVPEWQGRGIGSTLVRHGLSLVSDVPMVFLEGSPRYYPRFGFRPGGELGFRRPSLRIPEPAFQVLLRPGHEEWMTGTLVYPRAFWDHDCVGLREPPGDRQ